MTATEDSIAPVVYVIDDDQSSREMVRGFLAPLHYRVELFSSATDFLADFAIDPTTPSCVVSDVCMPQIDGIELQRRLNEQGIRIPLIFMSAIAGVPYAVGAMKAGAWDFIPKPMEITRLVECVKAAVDQDKAYKQGKASELSVQKRIALLTQREKQVMTLLAQAFSTKEIAARLGISNKTVFVHRARVLEKMEVDSLVQLSHLVDAIIGQFPAWPEAYHASRNAS